MVSGSCIRFHSAAALAVSVPDTGRIPVKEYPKADAVNTVSAFLFARKKQGARHATAGGAALPRPGHLPARQADHAQKNDRTDPVVFCAGAAPMICGGRAVFRWAQSIPSNFAASFSFLTVPSTGNSVQISVWTTLSPGSRRQRGPSVSASSISAQV